MSPRPGGAVNADFSPLLLRVATLSASNGLAALFAAAFSVVVLRSLSTDDVGYLGLQLATVALLDAVSGLGLATVHTKLVARMPNSIATLNGAMFTLVLVITVISMAAGGTILWAVGVAGPHPLVTVFVLAALGTDKLGQAGLATLAGMGDTRRQSIPRVVSNAVGLALATSLSVRGAGTLESLSACIATRSLTGFLTTAWLLRRTSILRPRWGVVRVYLRETMALGLSTFVGVLSLNVDALLIARFVGLDQLGLYYGAQRIAQVPGLIVDALSAVTLPALARIDRTEGSAAMARVAAAAVAYTAGFGFLIASVGIPLSSYVLELLFGDHYRQATPILQLLLLHGALRLVIQPYSDVWIARGLMRPYAAVSISYSVTITLLYAALIPPAVGPVALAGLGGIGAGLAAVIAIVIAVGEYVVLSSRAGLGIHPNFVLPVVASAIAVVLPLDSTSSMQYGQAAVRGAVAATVYFVALAGMRLVDRRVSR